MARTKEQNERIRENTKAKIHSAAIALFAEIGFAGSTMQDLAASAGVSVGLLYRHYKTKNELFNAISDEAILGHQKMLSKIEALDPRQAVNILADDILGELSASLEFSRFMEILGRNPSDKQKAANESFILSVAKIIGRGQAQGVFAAGDPVQLSQLLVSIFQGLSATQLLLKGKFLLPARAQIISFLEVRHG